MDMVCSRVSRGLHAGQKLRLRRSRALRKTLNRRNVIRSSVRERTARVLVGDILFVWSPHHQNMGSRVRGSAITVGKARVWGIPTAVAPLLSSVYGDVTGELSICHLHPYLPVPSAAPCWPRYSPAPCRRLPRSGPLNLPSLHRAMLMLSGVNSSGGGGGGGG